MAFGPFKIHSKMGAKTVEGFIQIFFSLNSFLRSQNIILAPLQRHNILKTWLSISEVKQN